MTTNFRVLWFCTARVRDLQTSWSPSTWLSRSAGRRSSELIVVLPECLPNIIIFRRKAAIYQPLGCSFGYFIARISKLDRRDCRAISLECGVQNYAIAIAVVAISFTGCDRTDIQAFVLIAAFFMS